jgi:hypothetical protein
MAHPPIKPGWKRIVLVGGPNDGHELTIRASRDRVVVGVTGADTGTGGDTAEVDPQSVEKGAVYIRFQDAPADDGRERFEFLGHRTIDEIRGMTPQDVGLRGDCDNDLDDADWWKK